MVALTPCYALTSRQDYLATLLSKYALFTIWKKVRVILAEKLLSQTGKTH